MNQRDKRRHHSNVEPPVLTDVAVSGDIARKRGLIFKARTRTRPASAEAERYLADRLKDAVREALSDAMVRAARGTTQDERQRQRPQSAHRKP